MASQLPLSLTGEIRYRKTLFGGVKLQVAYVDQNDGVSLKFWKDADEHDIGELMLPSKVTTLQQYLRNVRDQGQAYA